MAQQTTQFPPGGNLQNWTPGFSNAGNPIRGLRIDNTSGSWLSVVIPSLPVQFVPPYTLAWSMTLLTPLHDVTILSQGPPNSNSTSAGTNVTVYAYTDSIGDSNGNTYYTPASVPITKRVIASFLLAPGAATVGNILLPAVANHGYRIYSVSIAASDTLAANLIGYMEWVIYTPVGLTTIYVGMVNPTQTSITIYGDIIIPTGQPVLFDSTNNSSTRNNAITVNILYGDM